MKALKSLEQFRYIFGDTIEKFMLLMKNRQLACTTFKIYYCCSGCMLLVSSKCICKQPRFTLLTEFNSTDSIFLEACIRGSFDITDIL